VTGAKSGGRAVRRSRMVRRTSRSTTRFALALEVVAFGGLRGRGEKIGVEQLPDAESCPEFELGGLSQTRLDGTSTQSTRRHEFFELR